LKEKPPRLRHTPSINQQGDENATVVVRTGALPRPGHASAAKVEPFRPSFRVLDIKTSGAVIHVRVGGYGPAVLMPHGFGDTGDMWQALAVAMMNDYTVVVPDSCCSRGHVSSYV
jgi:pimeloyl-ACP methyl ester carboxylesterase